MLFEGLLLGKKKGPKNPGMGRPPPPYLGNARKKTFFFIDVFPISETYVGAQREVPRSEGAPVLTVEVTLWVTQNLGPR